MEWFDAAIDAYKKLNFQARGATITAHDPSDAETQKDITQPDPFSSTDEIDSSDVNEGFDKACEIAIKDNAQQFIMTRMDRLHQRDAEKNLGERYCLSGLSCRRFG